MSRSFLILVTAIGAATAVAAIAIRHQDQNDPQIERPKANDSAAQSTPLRKSQPSVESPVPAQAQTNRSPMGQTVSKTLRVPVAPATAIQTQTSVVAQSNQRVAATLKRVVAQAKADSQTTASPNSNPYTSANAATVLSSQTFTSNSYRPATGSNPGGIQPNVPSPSAPVQDAPTAEQAESVEIELPPGARLPAALAPDSQDLPLTPAQQTIKDRVAADFLEQVQTSDPTGSNPTEWNRLALDADERLRKLIGHDAFNRMTLSASLEALGAGQVPEPVEPQ